MEKFIFDLDGTLLTMNYDYEKEFFQKHFGRESYKILGKVAFYLDKYERLYRKYTTKDLSYFLRRETNLKMTEEIIDMWMDILLEEPDLIEEDVMEVLDYLKIKNKQLVILTNWFGKTQLERLKKAKLLDFFDEVITGDMVLKPHKEAYIKAMGSTKKEETIMIGDHLDKDYLIPRRIGIYSLLYDKNQRYPEGIQKIKRMKEIKDKY